jgi:outer membrane protein OmpA-like peptidoglycan-associated protein
MTRNGSTPASRSRRDRVLLTAACLAATVTALPACGPAPAAGQPTSVAAAPAAGTDAADCATPSALVLVVSVHRNVSAPDLPAALACPLRAAVGAHRPVGVVAVDGAPHVVLPAAVLAVTDANSAAHGDDVDSGVGVVRQAVRTASAQADGSDLLAAISLAADLLRSTTAAASPGATPSGLAPSRLEVLDSGLSDSGDLAMTAAGMTGADPDQVVASLAGRLPDLHGLDVDLVGFGYAVAPQQPLRQAQRSTVVAIWRAVLTAAGARVSVDPLPRTGPGPDTSHTTATVTVAAPVAPACRGGVYDDSSPVGFEQGSTRLRDPDAARQALSGLAGWLAADPNRRVTVTGTTSSEGGADLNRRLSQARADAVRDLLVQAHAAPEQITVVAAGYIADPPDLRPDGGLDPAAAVLNRSVRITTSGCP